MSDHLLSLFLINYNNFLKYPNDFFVFYFFVIIVYDTKILLLLMDRIYYGQRKGNQTTIG